MLCQMIPVVRFRDASGADSIGAGARPGTALDPAEMLKRGYEAPPPAAHERSGGLQEGTKGASHNLEEAPTCGRMRFYQCTGDPCFFP